MLKRVEECSHTHPRHDAIPGTLESTAQIKKRLNIANSTLHWLRKKEGFPAPLKLGQRLVRYESQKVDDWLVSRRPVANVGANK